MIRKRHGALLKKHVRWYSCILFALIIAAACVLPPSVFADNENDTGTTGGEVSLTSESSGEEPKTIGTTITIYKTTTGDNTLTPKEFRFRVVRVTDISGNTPWTDDETIINGGDNTVRAVVGPNVTEYSIGITIENLTVTNNAQDEPKDQKKYYYKITEVDGNDGIWTYDGRAFVVRILVAEVGGNLMVPRQGQEWFHNQISYDKKGGGNPVPPNEYNTFVNVGKEVPKGSLSVKKSAFNQNPEYPDEMFQFTLRSVKNPSAYFSLSADSGIIIRRVGLDGTYAGTDLAKGIFMLAYNTEVLIIGLPEGEYTINEFNDGYQVSYLLKDGTSDTTNTATVTVSEDTTNSVVFTNNEEGAGKRLIIEKSLAGEYESWGVGEDTVFRARVMDARGRYLTFSGAAPNYTYTGTSVAGSEVRFSQKQSAAIAGIPIGTQCKVEEIPFGGTPCIRSYDKDVVIIPESGSDVTVRVTNTYTIDINDVENLTISKKLEGSPEDWGVDDNTIFTARIRDITVSGDEYDLHFMPRADGDYDAVPIGTGITEVQFTASKPVVLYKLWTDRVYKVEETGGAGYETESTGDKVKLLKGGNMHVTVTNTYESGAGNLIISKRIAGSPGDWGVDEKTVFTAKIKDINANEYVLLAPQKDGSYVYKGISGSGVPASGLTDTVRFKAGSPAIISELDRDRVYKVEEQGVGTHFTTTYNSSTTSPEFSMDGSGNTNIFITNTYKHGTGNLIIRKKFEGLPADWGVDENTIFYVRVKDNTDGNYLLFQENELNGTFRAFANNGSPDPGVDDRELLELTAGNPIILTGLWANHEYLVVEVPGLHYSAKCESSTERFPEGGNMHVTVINTYERGKGHLVIKKDLAGSPGDWGVSDNTEFWVRVKEMPGGNYLLFDLQSGGEYKADGNSGSGTPTDNPRELIRITPSRAYVISGLEPNCEYVVEEVGGARYTAAYTGNNATLPEDSNMNVIITNTFIPYRPNTPNDADEPGKGSLVISKRLAGSPGEFGVNGNTVFSARVKDMTNGNYVLLARQPDGSYLAVGNSSSASATNDSRELVRFTSGSTVTIRGLQSNCVYAVEEVGGAYYTAAYTGNNVMLPDGGVMGVTITNTYGDDGDGDGGDDGDGDDKGRLVIKKANFSKTPANPHEAFTFFVKKDGDPVDLTAVGLRIRKTGGSGEYIASDLKKGSFTLTYDTEVTIDGLPLGRYTVAEYAAGYIKSYKLTDNSRMQADGTAITDVTVIFTNEEIDGDSPRPDDGSADDYFEVEVPLVPLADIESPQRNTQQAFSDDVPSNMPTTGIGTASALLLPLIVILTGAAVFIFFRIKAYKKTIVNRE